MKKFALLLAVFWAGTLAPSFASPTVMRDNASDLPYVGVWADGQNGGSGFLPWQLGGSNMTFFVGSSSNPIDTTLGFDGHPTEPQSWGMSVLPGFGVAGNQNRAQANRVLPTPVWPGGTISVDIKHSAFASNSQIRVYFIAATADAMALYGTAADTNYFVGSVDTGIPLTNQALHIVFTSTGMDTYNLALTPVGGVTTNFYGLKLCCTSISGPVQYINFYDDNELADQVTTLYVNSLIVTSPPPYVVVDEDGNGTISGFPLASTVTSDSGPGGPSQALVYTLPFPGRQGDVFVQEPPGGTTSDILRFNGDGTMIVYSDPFSLATNLSDTCDSLADGPGPTAFYNIDHQVTVIETGSETGTNGVVYTPNPGQPGYDASNPTYNFISDYPPLAADPFQAWQLKYFGCTNCAQAAANSDPDGDGMSNTNEFLAGTNPTNSTSVFQVTSVMRQGIGSNDVNVTWNAVGCKAYIVQVTPGGDSSGSYSNNFTDIPSSLTFDTGKGEGSLNYVESAGTTNKPARYYRVRLAQ